MVPRRADYVPRGLDLDTVESAAEIGGKVIVRAVEKREADDCADRSEPLDCCGLSDQLVFAGGILWAKHEHMFARVTGGTQSATKA